MSIINCEICGAELKSVKGLSMHISRMHKDVPEAARRGYLDAARAVLAASEKEAAPVAEPAKVAAPVEVPVPTPPTPTPAFELAAGDSVEIHGDVFQLTEAMTYVSATVTTVAEVTSLEVTGDDTWVMLKGGHGEVYSIHLDHVRDGSLASKIEVEDSLAKEAEFANRLRKFGDANEAKKDAERRLKTVRAECYEPIVDYVRAVGGPTDHGKSNHVCYASDYKAVVSSVPKAASVSLDTKGLVAWCIETGHTECLTQMLDVAAWKKLQESGVVPDEVIRKHVTPVPESVSYKLTVTKVD